jgi:hypothetical protein
MGTNSITNDDNCIFLLDDDNLSLYYGIISNKSDNEEEEKNIEDINNDIFEEKENKKPKSNILGVETLKFPVTFEWDNGGNNVYVTGNFCNWKQFFLMKKGENGKFILNLNLPKGKYQYKFKVDEIWKYNDKFPTINENGNINNIIDTSNWEITSENIEGKVTRNTSNNENIENSNPKKGLSKCKTNCYLKNKVYSTYIPKKNEFQKVVQTNFKSKSCLNFSKNSIGNEKFMKNHEMNILSDNISYKEIDIVPNNDIDHLNIKKEEEINNNKNPNFILSVPFRYRHKYCTFVYYKEKENINNS